MSFPETYPDADLPAYKELPAYRPRPRPKQKQQNRQQVQSQKNRETDPFFSRFQEPFPQQFNDFFGNVEWPTNEGFSPFSSSFGTKSKNKPAEQATESPFLEPIGPESEEPTIEDTPLDSFADNSETRAAIKAPGPQRRGSNRRTGTYSRRTFNVDPNIANHAITEEENGGVQYQPRQSARRPATYRAQSSSHEDTAADATASEPRRERKRYGNQRIANRRVQQKASEE